MQHTCYSIVKQDGRSGVFDGVVDATYILTMGSKLRILNIEKQLAILRPTKTIYIVRNDGFENCEKCLHKHKISSVPEDIIHAYKHIFKHASDKENILLLEDDFFWTTHFTTGAVRDVQKFIQSQKPPIYSLGSLNLLFIPIGKHWRLFQRFAAHAMIYSKSARKAFTDYVVKNFSENNDLEISINYAVPEQYTYHKPLAIQPMPDTPSKEKWGGEGRDLLSDFGKWYIEYYDMKTTEGLQEKWEGIYFHTKILLGIQVGFGVLAMYIAIRLITIYLAKTD